MNHNDLKLVANNARKNLFEAFYKLGSGHYGAVLSEIEPLVYLYFKEMNVRPDDPNWEGRDRFVLSKGHGGFGLYAVLAERGFIPRERLSAYENGVMLPKHADKHRIPGVDISTGSLGQGFSMATGMAIAAQRDKKDIRVYTLLGDGECNEGQVWEAAMAAAKYRLDNFVAVIDKNVLQFDGGTEEVMPLEPFALKWEAFGWHAINVMDGHNFDYLEKAFEEARATKDRPTVIIANTIKGKGISFMEGVTAWHGGSCNDDNYKQGLSDLETEANCYE